MPKYEVIAEFDDLVAKKRRRPGEVIEVTEERAAKLRSIGVIGAAPVAEEPKGNQNENGTPGEPKPAGSSEDDTRPGQDPRYTDLGGGWYLLANGEKVHGKKALEAALAGQGGEA